MNWSLLLFWAGAFGASAAFWVGLAYVVIR